MTEPEPLPLHRRRILQRAKSAGVDGELALRDIMFHQLLARLEASSPGDFVLKGAQALNVRGVTRRATTDVDLAARIELNEAVANVLRALKIDLGDGLLFQERAARQSLDGDSMRAGQGVRLSLEAELDGIATALNIDLVVSEYSHATPIRLVRTPLVSVPGVVPLDIEIYHLAQHLADKISATVASYGDGRASSRTKDLYDICAIALACDVDGADAVTALRDQLTQRGIEGVSEFAVPPPIAQNWPRFVAGLRDGTPVPVELERAQSLATTLANPLLNGDANGKTWEPQAERWR